ncbi:MAG: DUF3306 domain-containing protein [Aquisalimonadaceae bacterium]
MTGSDRGYTWRPETALKESEPDPGAGFIGRWSRRKTEVSRGEVVEELPAVADAGEDVESEEDAGPRIDPRTGKEFDELTDEDMPPVESLDTSSDLSVFMARNISPALRMKALSKVFHQPQYNVICVCAEYADDYTNFEALGDIVPHDMKSAIAREAEKLRQRLLGRGEEITPEEAEARIVQETRGERPQDFPDDEELHKWNTEVTAQDGDEDDNESDRHAGTEVT